MAVTNIKKVKNNHKLAMNVFNAENPRDTDSLPRPGVQIPSGETYTHDMWVPWCTDESAFSSHRIEVGPGAYPTFLIWQEKSDDGDHVRFCTDGNFHFTGNFIPGNSAVGGDRILYVEGTTEKDIRIHLENA